MDERKRAHELLVDLAGNQYISPSYIYAVVTGLLRENDELKKNRAKGQINEAYAKTIESNKGVISKLKTKVNKLEQKLEKCKKFAADDMSEYIKRKRDNSIGEDDE